MNPPEEESRETVESLQAKLLEVRLQNERLHLVQEMLNQYHLFFEISRDIFLLVHHPDGRIIEANNAAVAAYGYSREEFASLTLFDLRYSDSHSLLEAQMAQAWEIGIQFQTVHRRKDGSQFPVEVSSRGMSLGGEQVLAHAMRDITDRKRAEEALRRSEESLSRSQAIAHLGNWEWDIPTGAERWSDEMFRIFGYEPREMEPTYDTFVNAVHPDDREKVLVAVRDALEGTRPYHVEFRIVRSDNTVCFILGQGEVSRNAQGRPVRMVGTFLDVTDRRQALEALRQSEEKFRNLTEQTSDWVWETDDEGRFTYCNPGVRDLLGYPAEEFIGRRLADFMEPASAQRAADLLRRTIVCREPFRHVENALLHRDRRVVLFESNGVPVLDECGNLTGYHGVSRDITLRKRAEEDRRKLEERLREAQHLESLSGLAGGVAHDFNNLLVGILGYTEFAAIDLPPDSPVQGSLEQISLLANRMADLTRQMLAYAGQGKYFLRQLDLNTLLQEMTELFYASVSKKARIQFQLADSPVVIEADQAQIQQALMNLILNASESLEDQEGVISILTGIQPLTRDDIESVPWREELAEGDYAFVEVADNGVGMDPDTMKRVFDPFFTTRQPGRGLGLASVQGTIRGHKGTIHLESEAGEGTAVRLLFPAVKPGEEEERKPEAVAAKRGLGGGTVLVVDDEPPVRAIASRMLSSCGYEVLTGVGRAGGNQPLSGACFGDCGGSAGFQDAEERRAGIPAGDARHPSGCQVSVDERLRRGSRHLGLRGPGTVGISRETVHSRHVAGPVGQCAGGQIKPAASFPSRQGRELHGRVESGLVIVWHFSLAWLRVKPYNHLAYVGV